MLHCASMITWWRSSMPGICWDSHACLAHSGMSANCMMHTCIRSVSWGDVFVVVHLRLFCTLTWAICTGPKGLCEKMSPLWSTCDYSVQLPGQHAHIWRGCVRRWVLLFSVATWAVCTHRKGLCYMSSSLLCSCVGNMYTSEGVALEYEFYCSVYLGGQYVHGWRGSVKKKKKKKEFCVLCS